MTRARQKARKQQPPTFAINGRAVAMVLLIATALGGLGLTSLYLKPAAPSDNALLKTDGATGLRAEISALSERVRALEARATPRRTPPRNSATGMLP